MTETTTAIPTIGLVDKLNKGTSRDEWGNLNYWGFKTPNGMVRSRVTGTGLLEVRLFDPSKLPSYRKQMMWEDAPSIGSCYIEVKDADKGPDAKSMVPEVNALIEGHNDAAAKWHGKHVTGTELGYGNTDTPISIVVSAVYVEFDASANMTTTLTGKRTDQHYGTNKLDASKAREVTSNDYTAELKQLVAAEQDKIITGQAFLNEISGALASGSKVKPIASTYNGVGCVGGTFAKKMVDLVNTLAEETVEA